MRNFKLPTKRVAIFILILSAIGLFVLWNKIHEPALVAVESISAPANGSLAIKVDGFGFSPFDIMYISGAGLDPEAATSIIYTTHSGEVLTVPALRVTPTSVEVAVPPISYKKTLGVFAPDQTSLTVIQTKKVGSKLVVKTSNQSAYFMVYAPVIPSVMKRADAKEIPKGTITREFVAVAVKSLTDALAQVPVENTGLKASYVKAKQGMESMLAALDKFIKNPNTSIQLPTTDGGTVSLNAARVAWLDAFYAGFLGLAEERQMLAVKNSSLSFIPAAEAAEINCNIDLQSGQSAEDIIRTQVECLYYKSANQAWSLYDRMEFGKNADMWIIVGGLGLGLLTGGLSIEAQIGYAVVFAIITSQMKDGKPANVDSLPGHWGAVIGGYLDHIKGVPIIGDLSTMADIYKEKCKYSPSDACNKVDAVLSWPGKMLLHLDNGDADAFKMPGDQLVVAMDNIGSPEGGPELLRYTPVQPVKKTPVQTVPSKIDPPKKSPVKVVPVNYTTPVKTTPVSPGPSCSQLKQSALKSCQAGCGKSQVCYTDYSACTPGCEGTGNLLTKSNCINTCLGILSKCTGASSKCNSDCLNAGYATVCP